MQSKINIFSSLESIIGEEIPKTVVYVLTETGFNSKIALKNIKSADVTQIESFVNSNFGIFSHALIGSHYENMQQFEFLPGHRTLIESFPQYIDQTRTEKPTSLLNLNSNHFSTILKLIIETAETNASRELKGHRYDKNLKYFAAYIYLMCGRACYETLSANLPLPKYGTIGRT